MSDRDKREIFTQLLEKHLRQYFPPPCNYLLVQVTPLLKICNDNYWADLNLFENDFIIPVAKLLDNLRASKLPITFEDEPNRQIYVLIHLTEPGTEHGAEASKFKMTPGEFVLWAGKSVPGTLSMKYTKYVTERDGTPLPDPVYEETRMKIQEKDIPRCLTRAFFSELRRELKEKRAERYSITMRLLVGYNTTTESMKSLDYDRVLARRRRRAPKLGERTGSGVQESCDDPVAKSTDEQVLHQALSQYRNHRQPRGQDSDEYRSSSPTGTEASAYPPTGHTDRLTDHSDSSSDMSDGAEVAVNDVVVQDGDRPRSQGPESEACVTLRKPQDSYIGRDRAVSAETNQGTEVEPPVAKPMDGYLGV